MQTVAESTFRETWLFLCALHIQALSPVHDDDFADTLAAGLYFAWPKLTPQDAAREFFRPWSPAAEIRFRAPETSEIDGASGRNQTGTHFVATSVHPPRSSPRTESMETARARWLVKFARTLLASLPAMSGATAVRAAEMAWMELQDDKPEEAAESYLLRLSEAPSPA